MRSIRPIIWLVVMLIAGSVIAQPGPWGPPGDSPRRLETLRIWKMTEYMDLSEEQAAAFFPALNEHRDRREDLDSTEGAIQRELMKAIEEGELDQELVDEKVARLTKLHEQRLRMETRFMRSLSEYLTPEQQAKYLVFERRFRHMLRDAMKQHGMWRNRER